MPPPTPGGPVEELPLASAVGNGVGDATAGAAMGDALRFAAPTRGRWPGCATGDPDGRCGVMGPTPAGGDNAATPCGDTTACGSTVGAAADAAAPRACGDTPTSEVTAGDRNQRAATRSESYRAGSALATTAGVVRVPELADDGAAEVGGLGAASPPGTCRPVCNCRSCCRISSTPAPVRNGDRDACSRSAVVSEPAKPLDPTGRAVGDGGTGPPA